MTKRRGQPQDYIDIFGEIIKKSARFPGFPGFLSPSEPTLREFLISLAGALDPEGKLKNTNTNDYPTLKQHNNTQGGVGTKMPDTYEY